MFERYTEKARRSIFFARYEASMFGSPCIEPEHLLLGILREDPTIRGLLPSGGVDEVRAEVERRHPAQEKISTSIDLPLSQPAARALKYAAGEATALGHRRIAPGHLLLGLLRLDHSAVAEVLRPQGVDYDSLRQTVADLPSGETPKPPAVLPSEPGGPLHPLNLFTFGSASHLLAIGESQADQPLKRLPLTRKEALGHLIDRATAHHQWISRALVEPRVTAAAYPDAARAAAQKYSHLRWSQLVHLWMSLNHLLAHVILQIPEGKLRTPCRIGVEEEMPLENLIRRYQEYCEDLMDQILAKND
jgi:Clp amino terminal domain, pathogenicity island component